MRTEWAKPIEAKRPKIGCSLPMSRSEFDVYGRGICSKGT